MENKAKWRWGKYRWVLLGLIILNVIGVYFFYPIQPHIQVAPEFITGTLFTLPVIGDFHLSNTLLASFIGIAGYLVLMHLGIDIFNTYDAWLDPDTGVPSIWEPPEPSGGGS